MRRKSEIRPEPVQVFRQFAWNLAGTLARRQAVQKPRPAVKR